MCHWNLLGSLKARRSVISTACITQRLPGTSYWHVVNMYIIMRIGMLCCVSDPLYFWRIQICIRPKTKSGSGAWSKGKRFFFLSFFHVWDNSKKRSNFFWIFLNCFESSKKMKKKTFFPLPSGSDSVIF